MPEPLQAVGPVVADSGDGAVVGRSSRIYANRCTHEGAIWHGGNG